MKALEELYSQDGERSPPSVLDFCKTEYWNARPLWQSDLDHFAALGISGLDLANPDMVLKAGIILDDDGDTFVFSIYESINSRDLIARKNGRRKVILADDLHRWLQNLSITNHKSQAETDGHLESGVAA